MTHEYARLPAMSPDLHRPCRHMSWGKTVDKGRAATSLQRARLFHDETFRYDEANLPFGRAPIFES